MSSNNNDNDPKSPIEIARVITDQQRVDAYDVRTQVFVHEQGVDPNAEIEPEEDELAYHWVAYHHDHHPSATSVATELNSETTADPVPVGTVRLLPSSPTSAKLGRLAVVKAYRGQGIGRLLMDHLEAYAKSLGLQRIYMHAQNDKVDFYKSIGYTVYDHTLFYEEGIPHVKMERLF